MSRRLYRKKLIRFDTSLDQWFKSAYKIVMTSDAILDGLIKHVANATAEALRNAFERGRAVGREESLEGAREAFSAAMEKAFASLTPDSERMQAVALKVVRDHDEAEAQRARRGSARPLILGALAQHKAGVTAKELARQLDGQLEENTVRGTLNRLRHDGDVEKNGDRWTLTHGIFEGVSVLPEYIRTALTEKE